MKLKTVEVRIPKMPTKPIDKMFDRLGKEYNDSERAELLFGFVEANQYQDNFFRWVSHKQEHSS